MTPMESALAWLNAQRLNRPILFYSAVILLPFGLLLWFLLPKREPEAAAPPKPKIISFPCSPKGKKSHKKKSADPVPPTPATPAVTP